MRGGWDIKCTTLLTSVVISSIAIPSNRINFPVTICDLYDINVDRAEYKTILKTLNGKIRF